jgi:hypothetical protein
MTRFSRRFFAFRQSRSLCAAGALALAAALVFFAVLDDASHPAAAQGANCDSLRGQIAGLDRSNMRANPYSGQIRSQRAGLQRAEAYGHRLGCDRQQFFFFGSAPPPQCGQVNAQIEQLRVSVGQLESSARYVLDSPQRRQLVASYNAYCRQQTANQGGGFLGGLFGGPNQNQGEPGIDAPPLPDAAAPPPETAQGPSGGSELLCVRHCDGAFFPIAYAPGRDEDTLADFCKASCPNTDASVYSRVPGSAIQTAVGLDGKPYMSLPAALKYQKALDPSCSCRAAGASWATTLADAEAMLSHSKKGEIVVTQEKSDEMARPAAPISKKARKPATDDTDATDDNGDDMTDRDAAAAAQVPTAGTDSAGISAGGVNNQTSYPQGAGDTTEITGADGVKRRVRIVGPQLSPAQ